jgi:hypothetical protein
VSGVSTQVRELASVSLSSLLHGEEDAQVTALAQRFLATLGQPLRRRDLKNGAFGPPLHLLFLASNCGVDG